MRNLKQKPLQIGVIGCGSFLLRRVLPALQDLDTVQVVCVQNRNLEKAKKIAEEYAIPHAVSEREELLARVEAVHIASPNFCHEEDALACAAAHKPTLCEKPLSISVDSVKRMLAAFKERGVPFFVGHHLRFKKAILKAKDLLARGELGRLVHIRAYYYSQTIPVGNWRLERGNGGGALQEIGIHLVDLIHFITGEQIEEARALLAPEEGVERMVSFQGRLTGGATVSFECGYERPYYSGFEVIGTEARVVSGESLRQTKEPIETLEMIRGAGERTFMPIEMSDVYAAEFKHFAECVIHRVPSVIDAEISLANQRVIDLAYANRNCAQIFGSV